MVCAAQLLQRGTTDASPRSTSSRCAVSRHQPFGCESAFTSVAAGAFDSAGARSRFVVSCTIRQIRPRFTGFSEIAGLDVVAQEIGPVDLFLHDAAIHVDDVERAVGRGQHVHRTEALVRRREDLPLVVAVDRLQPAVPSSTIL